MLRDEFSAAFVQAVHCMACCNGLHCVDEAALEQVTNTVDCERL